MDEHEHDSGEQVGIQKLLILSRLQGLNHVNVVFTLGLVHYMGGGGEL